MVTKEKRIIKDALSMLLPEISGIFEAEPAVLRIDDASIMLVGDIHGDLKALNFILKQREVLGCENILFLGDYVDRGAQGVEVLAKVFQLKIEDPEHVFLLRGNHEDIDMNVYYGFYNEIGLDDAFLYKLGEIYEKMPIVAVLAGHTFCVHGGIKGADYCVDAITKAESFQYLWNDPSTNPGLTHSGRGQSIMKFGADVAAGFLATNNLKRIVRAHQAFEDGYCWCFPDTLLSLFSCPNYCGSGNAAAFAVMRKGEIEIYNFG